MGYKLTIDQGNSASKVAVWDGDEMLMSGTYPQLLPADIVLLKSRYGFDAAMFCSVADSHRITEVFAGAGVPVTEMTTALPLPLAVDYSTPSTLGVDRLAAAVGAWSLWCGHDILVADIGTAATYDVVSRDGHYTGGNIAPGIGMRLRALHAYTARLPLVASAGDVPLWGYSTETAMRSGAVNGVVAEIEYYRSRLGDDTRVVITGGWGSDVADRLGLSDCYDRMLVNRGLNCILRYNENK